MTNGVTLNLAPGSDATHGIWIALQQFIDNTEDMLDLHPVEERDEKEAVDLAAVERRLAAVRDVQDKLDAMMASHY